MRDQRSSMAESNAIYTLKNVTKIYEGREVLHIDYLDIPQGEILAIVGPSGAGKSTLLRLLNFLEPPTSGVIGTQFLAGTYGAGTGKETGLLSTIDGTIPPLSVRRRITTVFQRPVLLNATVANNVAYGLRIRGQRDVEKRVQAVLEHVGLAAFARASARTLSGGEAQRVALARALVIEPDVLLLDEPTANLDPYNVRLIEEIIANLNRQRGTTIVLVTHNVFQARRLAHRAALILDGRLIEVAPVRSFFETPADPRTASFASGEMVY
jgi:tungstate transport system ATP-binding protein